MSFIFVGYLKTVEIGELVLRKFLVFFLGDRVVNCLRLKGEFFIELGFGDLDYGVGWGYLEG